jgi:hypothetical protein
MSSNSSIAAVAAAVDALAGEDLDGASPEQLASDLSAVHAQIARLQAELIRRVGAFDASGGAEQLPEGSAATTQAWLRHELRESPGAAKTLVSAARRLRDLPQVARAFATGSIALGHVRVITRTATDWRLDAVQQVEGILVDAARRLHPAQLGKLAARIRLFADPDGPRDDDARAHRRRHLRLGIFDGTLFLEGQIPMAAGGEELITALDALERPDAPDLALPRRRTRSQRLADALVDLASLALNQRATPQVGGERPHVTVVVDEQTLAGHSGQATFGWGGPITADVARRVACDAQLTRVVTDSQGHPRAIDHSQRAIPHWLRRLLVVRDRGCRGPGCDRPAGWCEGHHLRFRDQGGRHDLDNLILLCRRCHMLVHERRWSVKLLPDDSAEWTDPVGRTSTTVPDDIAEPAQQAIKRLGAQPP